MTQIDGWVLLNSVTARLIPGTQAQNMTGVADELQDLPPASTDALALALALALAVAVDEDDEGELLPLLLQAASSKMAAAPEAVAVILRFLHDILAKLLCPVLPFWCAVAVLASRLRRRAPRSRGVRSAAMTSGC